MAKSLRRTCLILIHVFVFCLITTVTSESADSPIQPEPAVDPQDIAILDELLDWVSPGQPGLAEDRRMAETIRDRPHSFELFRRYHDKDVRRARVQTLPFGPTLARAAERHGVDSLLLASIAEVESSFNPHALSHRGAVGLMQVMPDTAGMDHANLTDPEVNVNVGARYVAWLLELYGGDLELTLAAYNAGPGAVQRFGGLPPYRETRRFVEKVLRIYVGHHHALWQRSENGDRLALL